MPRKLTKEQFIERANVIHENKYDYSGTEYINNNTKVKIYCEDHNTIFWQTPGNHLSGITTCNTCGVQKRNICLIHIWEDRWKNDQKKTKENIIKFLNNQPQQPLTEEIEIDMAADNPQIYISLGYKIISQTEPQIYLEGIWDCGKMRLIKI